MTPIAPDAPGDQIPEDEILESLMAEAGFTGTVADFRALLMGIEAAPADRDQDAWLDLVAPGADPALAERLRQVRAGLGRARRPVVPREDRLPLLRAELDRRGLDGFVIPRADEHQGEYVSASAERLAWLTGFTGSAGVAIVLRDRAAIFVDGRYTLQVRDQVDGNVFEFKHLVEDPHAEWAAANLPKAGRLGFDPRLHTAPWAERTARILQAAGAELVPQQDNPVDLIWRDRPAEPIAPVRPHDVSYAGKPAAEKREEIAAALAGKGVDAAVLTAPESVAWLLNIRGGDVPRTPLPLSYAVIDREGQVELFIDARKFVPGLNVHLGNGVTVRPPSALGAALDSFGAAGRTVMVDPGTAGVWILDRLSAAGATVRRDGDPCALPRARKNPVELEGARNAHLRDAVAVARFLHWLSREAPGGSVDEIGAAERLLAFRAEGALFRDLSFDTISGAGPNGAVVHYRVTPETNRRLEPGSLYLIDSGAQYLDGTTDITRTVAVGAPTEEMRDRFTLVLKGHIALATMRFPKGTTGSQLDVIARQFLWHHGVDYDHGTGHGIGSYLSVHEGPARIAKMPNPVALEPGMILSNEPGYYKTGAYGIRIENLIVVRDAAPIPGAEREMLEFETLTLAPIDRALIRKELLSPSELAWLDAYHARVRELVGPLLPAAEERAWLEAATAPL